MFGGVGFRLPWAVREAVGVYPAQQGLVLVRLCAADARDGAWAVTESRISEERCPVLSDAAALADFIHKELVCAGWEQMPLALAFPASMAQTRDWELSVLLTGRELQAALLWALRAEADELGEYLSDDVRLLCMPMPDSTTSHCYWLATMEGRRIQAYFSAFAAAGLQLMRLTICPPGGGVLADEIEAAREPRMPWETMAADGDALTPAIYAGLLMRAGMAANLYWRAEQPIMRSLRSYAAAGIAVLAAVFFLADVTADTAACMTARTARDRAAEELAQRETEFRRMESFAALRADVTQREQAWAEFASASLPVRALLVHLGTMTVDGVRLTGVHAEAHEIRLEGEAVDYAALAAFMGAMETDSFFPADVTLEYAGEGRTVPEESERVRFTLRSAW